MSFNECFVCCVNNGLVVRCTATKLVHESHYVCLPCCQAWYTRHSRCIVCNAGFDQAEQNNNEGHTLCLVVWFLLFFIIYVAISSGLV